MSLGSQASDKKVGKNVTLVSTQLMSSHHLTQSDRNAFTCILGPAPELGVNIKFPVVGGN